MMASPSFWSSLMASLVSSHSACDTHGSAVTDSLVLAEVLHDKRLPGHQLAGPGDKKRREEAQPHKLAMLVFILAGAIKKLRAWAANAPNAQSPMEHFRGMSNKKIFDTFMVEGGTELAPMSTTAALLVALQYCQGPAGNVHALLWLRTDSWVNRYSPLSFLKPLRKKPIVLKVGSGTYQTGRPW